MPTNKEKNYVYFLAGIDDTNNIDQNISLKSIQVNDVMIEEINSLIKEAYQISYPIEKTREMTLAK